MKLLIIILSATLLLFSGCKNKKGGSGFNLFPVSEDVKLGKQVSDEINSNSAEYPILDPAQNKEVYDYINKIRNTILNSGKVKYKEEFAWEFKIIDKDDVINAFCTPGGYIYVYTGLIKFLDSEDQLAGVIGHEIAHADLRHSTRQMTKLYGVQVLTSVILGDREALKQVTNGLVGLKFSRSHETESDNASVRYLCSTPYNAAGGGGFFEKIVENGGGGTPEFMSTHPSPDNRVENFKNQKVQLGCKGDKTYDQEYARIKGLLD